MWPRFDRLCGNETSARGGKISDMPNAVKTEIYVDSIRNEELGESINYIHATRVRGHPKVISESY